MINVYPSTWFRASRANAGGAPARSVNTGNPALDDKPIVGRIYSVAYWFDGLTIKLRILKAGA